MGDGLTSSSKFTSGDRVRLKSDEGVIADRHYNGADVRFDNGHGVEEYIRYERLEKVIPKAPERGSLVLIGNSKYYVRHDYKLAFVHHDGSFSQTHYSCDDAKAWEDVYRPGYKVAKFD